MKPVPVEFEPVALVTLLAFVDISLRDYKPQNPDQMGVKFSVTESRNSMRKALEQGYPGCEIPLVYKD